MQMSSLEIVFSKRALHIGKYIYGCLYVKSFKKHQNIIYIGLQTQFLLDGPYACNCKSYICSSLY